VLAGLRAAGVDLAGADAVIGTSAGAFVGAALAGGHDLEQLVATQFVPDPNELSAAAPEGVLAAWYAAFASGGSDGGRSRWRWAGSAGPTPSRCREPRDARSFGLGWSEGHFWELTAHLSDVPLNAWGAEPTGPPLPG